MKQGIDCLYKFKSLENKDYVLDIIENNRLYFPTRSQLNDPLEGVIQPIHYATLGSSYFREKGYLQPEFYSLLENYRILSLAQSWKNMQMWAHYSNNYNGVCIAFKYKDVFNDAKEVKYKSKKMKPVNADDILQDEEFDTIVRRNLLCKSKNWEYEQECRIIRKTTEEFINFSSDCIKEVILGNVLKMDKDVVVELSRLCYEKNIKISHIVFCTDYFELYKESFVLEEYLAEEYNSFVSNDVIIIGDKHIPVQLCHWTGNN